MERRKILIYIGLCILAVVIGAFARALINKIMG